MCLAGFPDIAFADASRPLEISPGPLSLPILLVELRYSVCVWVRHGPLYSSSQLELSHSPMSIATYDHIYWNIFLTSRRLIEEGIFAFSYEDVSGDCKDLLRGHGFCHELTKVQFYVEDSCALKSDPSIIGIVDVSNSRSLRKLSAHLP